MHPNTAQRVWNQIPILIHVFMLGLLPLLLLWLLPLLPLCLLPLLRMMVVPDVLPCFWLFFQDFMIVWCRSTCSIRSSSCCCVSGMCQGQPALPRRSRQSDMGLS